MKIGIIGGGINGLMIAIKLSNIGHKITLFEKNKLLSGTSMATSKLIHGGLRYLENFQFFFVKESLKEREWWLTKYPEHVRPVKIFLPIYNESNRNERIVSIGLKLYDFLFRSQILPRSRKEKLDSIIKNHAELETQKLKSVHSYYDAIMDDIGLGNQLINEAIDSEVELLENSSVLAFKLDGSIDYVSSKNGYNQKKYTNKFDLLINAAGPWAKKILDDSSIPTKYDLDLIRGSHILVSRNCKHSYILEIPDSKRIFFVLPFGSNTLIGTTEIEQSIGEPIVMENIEIEYLINSYNKYFLQPLNRNEIIKEYSGLRPLISSDHDPVSKSRDFTFEQNERVISVFGGKWTTSRLLAEKLIKLVEKVK